MTDVEQISRNLKDPNYTYNKNGHKIFAKNNKIGRMKKKGFTLTDLNKVIVEYEKSHDLPILKHYIEQLYKDNNLLSKYIDKNVPTKTINELTGKDGSPLNITLQRIRYSPTEGEDKENIKE